MLISCVFAGPYYVTSSTQPFHSKEVEGSFAYIRFSSGLLPLTFSSLYRDSQERWHFNNYWIRVDANTTITKYFTDSQFKAVITKASGNSTFELGGVADPTRVLIDGTLPANYTWASNVVTVTVEHTSSKEVFIDWGSPVSPPSGNGNGDSLPPSDEEEPPTWDEWEEPYVPWTHPKVVVPSVKPVFPLSFELGIAIIIICLLIVVIYSQVKKPSSFKQKMKQKTQVAPSKRRKR